MESNDIIAPFVLKTYQMVNDPSLDGFIRWGIADNSFIVVQPLDFSQRLLPAYFKHNNFSSFIRQLNTYGFRKVDPDRWEFASEWFLRGQTHLLKNLGRKKQIHNRNNFMRSEEDDEVEMAVEIARLNQEQKALERELIGMNKRLEATERRPEQMMALLHKVAEDPEILPRMMLEKDQRSKRLIHKKRQRILIPPSPLPSPSSRVKNKEDDECRILGGWTASSPEGYYGNEPFWQSSPSPDTISMAWPRTKAVVGGGGLNMESGPVNGISMYGNYTDGGGGGFNMDYSGGVSPEPDVRPPPAYPFSLLGGGF
ncbi:heat stress transcription factor C-1-like [Cynara cardunculus var. scolymus]|uniref:Heat shock factor (HSF)-type, DNA-binding n=1 Tax=Cynara cardunculus var. scolymus TaxID=59895 RepID=A0A103XNF8_CYNCS|nr:heat stress transcription factor C-1-like [Cynara cardunculus var. scolymus]KVH93900.1 Heat shock factor (HSF)-type, DNA-binding [Cynara cardunculus var. scolymus]